MSGSVWGGSAHLEEELSIGSAEGEDVYLLGSISSLWYHQGRIYLADQDVPVVRVYGPDGGHLFDIGRQGAGPGEFESPLSLRVHPDDGRIFIRDDQHGRINVHDPEGRYLESWPLVSAGFMTSYQMILSSAADLYTYAWLEFEEAGQRRSVGYMRVDPTGVGGDTIRIPDMEYSPATISLQTEGGLSIQNAVPFSPYRTWVVTPGLDVVAGISSDYRFSIRHPDGRTTIVERDQATVPVDPDERRWYRDRAIANMRRYEPGWAWNGPAIPSTKPAYRMLWADTAGRVWVLREGPGVRLDGCDPAPPDYDGFRTSPCWEPSLLLDVFDLEGRYLGPVRAPDGLQMYPLPYIGEDLFVALAQDDEGVPRVKRFRLELPTDRGPHGEDRTGSVPAGW